jgi:hypothetical protein
MQKQSSNNFNNRKYAFITLGEREDEHKEEERYIDELKEQEDNNYVNNLLSSYALRM